MKLMKTIALALIAVAAFAQPSVVSTYFSAPVTAQATTLTVNSATGISAPNYASGSVYYLKAGNEYMQVVSVSSTTIGVIRGVNGTRPAYHPTGESILAGPAASFSGCYAAGGAGPCAEAASPQYSSHLFYPTIFPATISTAGAATYAVGDLMGGLILDDPNGAGRTRTLPTAALIVQSFPGAITGSAFYFDIRNTADAAETITVAAGTGGTTSGTMTIAQNNSKRFLVRLTNVTNGNEAYTVYSMGTVVF